MELLIIALIVAGILWIVGTVFSSKSGFSPFIAARYLKPKRSFTSVITILSIAGVAIGVGLLTVVMAVMTGFGERMKEVILGFEPHIVVDSRGILPDWQEPYSKIQKLEGVTSVTPYVRGQVIMDFQGLRSAPLVRGIIPPEDSELELMTSKIYKPTGKDDFLQEGGKFFIDIDTAVVGDGIARNQGIQVGDTITVYSPKDMQHMMKVFEEASKAKTEEEKQAKMDEIEEMTLPQELIVSGIFDSGHHEFDNNVIFTHLETAQDLYNFDLDTVHGLAIRTEEAFQVRKYEQQISKLFGGTPSELGRKPSRVWMKWKTISLGFLILVGVILLPMAIKFKNRNFWIAFGVSMVAIVVISLINIMGPPIIRVEDSALRVMSWTVMHKGIFDAIAAERQMMYLILFVIMIVGAFCTMNTMITITVQKRGEIGLIKALGAQESQIASIFLLQGLLVGVIGVVLGFGVGQLIIEYRNVIGGWIGSRFGFAFFDEAVYGLAGGLPAKQNASDILTICGGSMIVTMVAALIPAMIAALEEPAKALRSD